MSSGCRGAADPEDLPDHLIKKRRRRRSHGIVCVLVRPAGHTARSCPPWSLSEELPPRPAIARRAATLLPFPREVPVGISSLSPSLYYTPVFLSCGLFLLWILVGFTSARGDVAVRMALAFFVFIFFCFCVVVMGIAATLPTAMTRVRR